ncbi:MAG: 6-phosphofructokinase [Deltaproteobacteria bacterium]|nr:6-phosphofructokinase [Deltaproteobacteria bacterium]MCW5802224.1 6-phosphofructokinase [Deltaproteobacteria bacterium]
MRRVGVLTSGGDAPGMNAAIRGVVRAALDRGWEPLGIADGFAGLIEGRGSPLTDRDVGGIIQRGGTLLGSARAPAMLGDAGQAAALASVARLQLDALVTIGGNGTHTGAHALARRGLAIVGVPSTIDNDVAGCDITIGATSALEVALEAIDRLKVTASSLHRAFLVEVMGRDCGYLAVMAGIAGGAEGVAVPEVPTTPEQVAETICAAYRRGKAHALIVVAEGIPGGAEALARRLAESKTGFDVRVTRIGHVQRGAEPSAFDRILGSWTGAAAIDTLARGTHAVSVGVTGNRVCTTPLADVAGRTKAVDPAWLQLARVLSR